MQIWNDRLTGGIVAAGKSLRSLAKATSAARSFVRYSSMYHGLIRGETPLINSIIMTFVLSADDMVSGLRLAQQ